MSAIESRAGQAQSPLRVVVIGAIGGAIAGMMMAAIEMIYGWLSDAHSLWDAPMGVWAWVGGLDDFGTPGDHVGSIVLGLAGHMANSMMIGVVFAALMFYVIGARDLITPVILGVVYGLVVWVVMRYAVLPLRSPEDTLFTKDLVSPQWVWWVAHAALGMTAGIYYDLVSRRVGRAHARFAIWKPRTA